MAYLEIETRDGTHRVNLERDRLSIGRLSYNDVVLPFAQISRQHAELRLINNQWWIADLHSTNGLQLNAQRIQEHALTSGDQIVLAPGISIRFVTDSTPATGQSGSSAPTLRPVESAPTWAERVRQQPALPGGTAPPTRTQPTRPVAKSDLFVPPDAVAPLHPRSPFSDDEERYVPPAMQPPASPNSSNSRGFRDSSFAASPIGTPGTPGMTPNNGHLDGFSVGGGNGSGGYPAPPGPLRSGAGHGDPFLREGPKDERQRITSGPAPKLLHVCQTCGQLTAPDSVYCQSCHHSIAHECVNCRLSLLPIQERCPRCHTPNQHSVRRTHPGRSDF
jgi:hypothetical protein